MGAYTNKLTFNVVAWTTAVVMTGLSLVLVWNSLTTRAG
jgi:Mn2+/Fe2+ NRAMP family transporter